MDFITDTVAGAPDLPPEGEPEQPKAKRQRCVDRHRAYNMIHACVCGGGGMLCRGWLAVEGGDSAQALPRIVERIRPCRADRRGCICRAAQVDCNVDGGAWWVGEGCSASEQM